MRNLRFILAAAVLAAASTTTIAAPPNSARPQPRPPLGTNPYPVIWGGQQPAKPPPPAPKPPVHKESAKHTNHNGPYHGHDRFYTRIVYAYYPSYDYSYPTPFANAPVHLSSEDLYGPQAMQRFMGFAAPAGENGNAEAPEPKKPVQRTLNAQARARVWRYIGFGDAQFAKQKYSEANSRYRTASQNAPQLADPCFRQGFALSAMGRYEQAVKAMKRGLTIDPKWPQSSFELKELCGPDLLAKGARFDSLAEAATNKPNDANLMFLLGVHLHFDGQPERAEKFFERAAELAGPDAEHVRAFLAKAR